MDRTWMGVAYTWEQAGIGLESSRDSAAPATQYLHGRQIRSLDLQGPRRFDRARILRRLARPQIGVRRAFCSAIPWFAAKPDQLIEHNG